ncbi:carboxy terminal-processing peptidase [Bowmanella yangjiangensis]|uniref:Carboxy terminal-processing peptidase n=1 Tax=Bowmanella yangjiangensis TaxID=2811230 RepID=A0ABS3CTY0_9ALTE|nr:carboxy terminal-processing peptidase [Bowmanella yangjiangensis]MBN7820572.1 carboxy terminal-processing peptidase [Bowmanella yangjiangensis]
MKNAIHVSVAAALLAASYGAGAVATTPSAHDLPNLEQESQHAVATKRISSLFTRAHYKEIELNDALSERVYDRFLKALDPNKNVFTAADIAELEKYRASFDDALERGQLAGVYDIYQQNLKRRVERYEYALSLLDSSFDFEKAGDALEFNREDASWPKDVAELNELWRQRVKYDALNLKMAGKDEAGVKDLLSKRYERAIKRLQQTESEDVFQTLMNSFARTIEAHTSYLSPRNAERFQMDMNLSFEGIGAVLQSLDDHTVIRSIVPGGPADLSKQIKPEDRIVGVAQEDDEFVDVVGWRLDEVVDLIKGPKGSVVRLQLLKGAASDSATPEVVSLTRDKIKLEDRAAKSEVYVPDTGPNRGQKLGVISIPSFYNNLHEDVRKELDSLKSENVEGVIVDLRGNGGGSLTEATQLTGLFIDKGPVVQIRDSAGRIREERDNDGIVYYDGPLTVLVDRYSASASEIFAAAMQDYGRALIVGEQTFGKGTVQQHRGLGRIYDLYDNPLGSVQITIAKFYRINGGSTQHKGVVPDILFPSAIEPSEWGESREENALPWDSIQRANYTTFGETGSTVREVSEKHMARIQQDPEFAYILEDINEYRARKDDKTISLVESERRKEKQENEQKALARANERLTRMGLAKVENLDDLPEALEELDPILDEAAAITYDVVGTGKYAIRSK